MKNLYHHKNNKGNKVYPSPSVSSFSHPNRDALSALNLLPAAILSLASLLSLEDREVLAYLITRSINTTTSTSTTSSSSSNLQEIKKKCKKSSSNTTTINIAHNYNYNNNKHPIFDCGCFDCYTSFWFRWDSSPNRELIHQAIEAFEEHLTKGELLSSSSSSSSSPSPSSKNNINHKGSGSGNGNGTTGGKKKDRMGRRVFEKPVRVQAPDSSLENFIPILSEIVMVPEKKKISTSTTTVVVTAALPLTESDRDEYVEVVMNEEEEEDDAEEIEIEVVMATAGNLTHSMTDTVQLPANKGLVRKVLPDILGLFNSRLWSIWNPSI